MDLAHLDWPFFDDHHRALAAALVAWAPQQRIAHDDVDEACRQWVRALGAAGHLRHCVTAEHGGARPTLESRSLCVARETLAFHDGLADFAFAMQGLGSGPITLAGSAEQRERWLPRVARGEAIAAFALSEPDAGSDVGAMTTTARREGGQWVLDGDKTWISNGGIADFYCVFARTGREGGARGISAFLVPADAPGLRIAERIDVIAPHPLARLAFEGCRLPADVAARRRGRGLQARDAHARHLPRLGRRGGDRLCAPRAARGDRPCQVAPDVRRHARRPAARRRRRWARWRRRSTRRRCSSRARRGSATCAAARPRARPRWRRWPRPNRRSASSTARVQLHGGLGVRTGSVVERLYRDIRALRIYEGATEVQKLIVGREVLA